MWNQLFRIKCVKHKLNKWVCFIFYESYSIVNSWNHESWFLDWVKFCHARQQWVSFYLSIWSEDMKKGFSGSMTGSTLPVLFITSVSDLGQLSLKMRLQLIWYIKIILVDSKTPLTKKLATSGAVRSDELVKSKPFLPDTLRRLFKDWFQVIWLFSRIQSHLYSMNYAIH